MTIYMPYTYLIGWSNHNLWYYGVRYATTKCLYDTGCHPDELWKTYFTSSKTVDEIRNKLGEPNIIQVRRTFRDAASAQNWEVRVLQRMNVLTNDKWLNAGIAGAFIMTEEIRNKISVANRKPKPPCHGPNVSAARKGIIFSDAHKENLRKAGLGKKQSTATKNKRSNAISQLKWWNDGVSNRRCVDSPGDNWMPGRIKGFKWKTRE